MNFCVLVEISKRSASFWYKSDGNPYAPMSIKGSNDIPLYFYINGNEFVFGNIARDRFYSNDTNAYGNYFEIVKDPSAHFNIYGSKKPAKQLLYYGIEQCLSYFVNSVLYKSESIESYRLNFPLRFIFKADIEEKEKKFIGNLFLEAGYRNIEFINYDKYLFESLAKQDKIKPQGDILLLKGIDNSMYIGLYRGAVEKCESTLKIEGHGADPRVKILAEIIIEDIMTRNSYLRIDKDFEIGSLLLYSTSLLEHITPIISGNAILSDGKPYYFRIKERMLNEQLLYYSNEIIVYSAIDDILKINSISANDISIILATTEINTSYFSSKLLKKYPHVIGVRELDQVNAMKLIFNFIEENNYKTYKPLPEINSDVESINSLLSQIEREMANKKDLETELANLVSEIKKLQEKKRELLSEKQALKTDIDIVKNTEKKQGKPKEKRVDSDDFFKESPKKPAKISEAKKSTSNDFDF
jgi:hypothetical protein